MNTIVVVDYGVGNLGSIQNMIKKLGYKCQVASEVSAIEQAEKLIVPGVGSFDNGMKELQRRKLLPILNKKALEEKIPVMGICLGMQLFAQKSEEGTEKGLAWVDAEFARFRSAELKVPHIGWNSIHLKKTSRLMEGISEPRFYFVHSYHCVMQNTLNVLSTTFYGEEFVSSYEKDNIIGVQFHPEKSHRYGMKLFRNFIENY
jgi:glutamine amidotransferase